MIFFKKRLKFKFWILSFFFSYFRGEVLWVFAQRAHFYEENNYEIATFPIHSTQLPIFSLSPLNLFLSLNSQHNSHSTFFFSYTFLLLLLHQFLSVFLNFFSDQVRGSSPSYPFSFLFIFHFLCCVLCFLILLLIYLFFYLQCHSWSMPFYFDIFLCLSLIVIVGNVNVFVYFF